MRHWFSMSIVALMLLLSGCAGTSIRSEVTVFQEWPADLREKVFVFERTREQDNNLEYRNYENLVRGELMRLGFVEASTASAPKLKLSIGYSIKVRDIRIIEGMQSDPFWYASPLYGHRWRGHGYYGPYYDPFWPMAPSTEYVESTYQVFSRQLKIGIAQLPSGKKLYDVTVNSEGNNGSLATVMPYLVRSAFSDFPGPSGVARTITLKMQN